MLRVGIAGWGCAAELPRMPSQWQVTPASKEAGPEPRQGLAAAMQAQALLHSALPALPRHPTAAK